MNYKRKVYAILIVSVVAILVSLVLALPEKFGLCAKNDISCLHDYIDNFNEIVQLVFIFSIPIAIISFILLFFQEQIFRVWSKFTIIFLPIAIITVIWMAQGTRGTLISIDEEIGSLFSATIFLITSLLIIAIKSFKLRKGGE